MTVLHCIPEFLGMIFELSLLISVFFRWMWIHIFLWFSQLGFHWYSLLRSTWRSSSLLSFVHCLYRKYRSQSNHFLQANVEYYCERMRIYLLWKNLNKSLDAHERYGRTGSISTSKEYESIRAGICFISLFYIYSEKNQSFLQELVYIFELLFLQLMKPKERFMEFICYSLLWEFTHVWDGWVVLSMFIIKPWYYSCIVILYRADMRPNISSCGNKQTRSREIMVSRVFTTSKSLDHIDSH